MSIIEKITAKIILLCRTGPRLQSQQLRSFSILMREPLRGIAACLQENSKFIEVVEQRRSACLPRSTLQRHYRSFEFDQKEEFLRLNKEDLRSRIHVGFHFGDFIYGMNYLANLVTADRRQFVLSDREGKDQYFENLSVMFGKLPIDKTHQLLRSSTDSTGLSALLREGSCTLTTFCDLPSQFGVSEKVKFLDRDAWFSRGPAALAVANRVPILPVINLYTKSRNKIVLAPQIEAHLRHGESFTAGVNRISQQLVSFFERSFRKSPEQWRYFRNLPSYFSPPQQDLRPEQFD